MRRKLKRENVYAASDVAVARHEVAMNLVAERVKTDAEFAALVIQAGQGKLRPEILKDANDTIARTNALSQGVVLDDKPEGWISASEEEKAMLKKAYEDAVPKKVFQLESDKDEGHGCELSKVPDGMKSVPVNVPISTVEVSQEELKETLRKLSKQQEERLDAAGLTQ